LPTQRFYRFAACAVSLAAATSARAVIFQSTGDPTFNTAAPTGTLAGSGWQYQINYGSYLATPIGPTHIVTAAHQGAIPGNTFNYNGVNYTVIAFADGAASKDFGDLRVLRVDKPILSYAPLYESAGDGSENGKNIVVMGRGTQRGSVINVNGVDKGWNWGASDFVRRWGENKITGFANSNSLIRFDFDLNTPLGTGVNEAIVSAGDSGGAAFINVNGQWKLAGINYSVTGPYSIPPGTDQFTAALYDTSGLFDHQTGAPGVGPSGAYASRISSSATSIKALLALPPTWKTNANGTWATAANWANGGVPNAVGAIADFRTIITAPRSVTYSGTVTVGTMDFDSTQSYSIVGGVAAPSTLHLNVASGNAAVNVASGNHSISGLYLDDPTAFNIVQASSTLTTGFSASAQPITKEGAGTLAANRLIGGSLAITQGAVAMTGNGSSTGTSKVTGLSVSAGAKLDLKNNDLVVANTPVGAKVGSNYTGLTGLIAQGQTGDWTGAGISSSAAAAANGLTALGIAGAGDVLGLPIGATGTWSGQTISASDALIAYTYAGDANLDGFISGDDYSAIDFNVGTSASGWYNGDFNYDGIISGDDYSTIDFNYAAQGAPLIVSAPDSAMMSGVAVVPEPGSLSLVAFASATLLLRRRRRA
jgi:hypothetical protein